MTDLTTEQWLNKLLDKYTVDYKRRSSMQLLYESEQPTVPIIDRYKDAYSRLLGQSRTPWGRLAVDIVSERLNILGFKGVENPDAIWAMMRKNHIESMQKDVHREALSTGTSYVGVWENDDGTPRMSYESSLLATHVTAPGDASETIAAIKVWFDDISGRMRCLMFLPDEIIEYQSDDKDIESASKWLVAGKLSDKEWSPVDAWDNPHGVVTLVPFTTRPNWQGYGRSDLTELEPIIARIETLTVNTMLAVELGAFRQKWATGLDIPKDADGKDLEPYKTALDRLWISEDPDTKFGVFQDTDIRPYLQGVEDAIGQLSAVSRIPALYFNQSGLSNPPSASSLEASETGLVNKVIERSDRFGESWEVVANLGLMMSGAAASTDDLTTYWKDPRTQSDAQTVDAAVKLESIGVPWEAVMEYLGYKPDDIKRMKAMRSADTFNQLLNTPLPQATRIVQEAPAQADEPVA